MPSLPLRRTGRCWRATRICPAATNSAPSSNDSSHNRPATSSQKAPKKAKTATSSPHRPDNEVGEMTERKPNLRPVRELTPSLQFRTIHGYRRAFRVAGSGPAILLIHGIGDNSTTWSTVQTKLAQRFTVIAPDLLGHGKSDKPRADYSVAAYANGMRDLLSVLDIDRVTVIGHSLGGGVAMQFAYQFPQLVDRLILVGAGGVTKDVNIALRWASLPMLGSEALALLRVPLVLPVLQAAGPGRRRAAGFHGLGPRPARRAAHSGRPARADRVVGVRPDIARRGGLARPGGHHAGPMLFDRIRSRAIDLGRTGFGDPGQPRPARARRDARFATRSLRGLGTLPLPRRSGPLRRSRRAVHRLHRAGHLRPGSCFAICCVPASAKVRSPDRSAPGSRCWTPWAPTNAAPPDHRLRPTRRSIGTWLST